MTAPTAVVGTGTTGPSDDERLGALLVAGGLLTEEALERALGARTERGHGLTRVLIEDDLVTESDLVATLASHLKLEYVDLSDYPIDAAAARLVSDSLARRYLALPIGWIEGRLIVAMADPSNVFAIDDIRTVTGAELRIAVATKQSIVEAIGKHHRMMSDAENVSAEASSTFESETDLSSVREVSEESPIVRLVNLLISQAIADRASDIHVEPGERDVRVRYRIDGVLHEVMRPPKNIQSGIVSRLKVMADINIAERRVPQDGRINTVIGGRDVDLRVATLPTVHGEKVVMRVLDKSTALLRLTDLGFLPENMVSYERSYKKAYGTILVTGPTGSGKSTTLYATLNILNSESKNVITVEDPVEYQLPGINQMQVKPQGRSHLRGRPAEHPAIRPRHRPGRRDPRPGDGNHRHRGGPHRAPGPHHPPHQRRRLYPEPADRDGCRALSGRQRHRLHRGPAAGPEAVHPLPERLQARDGRADSDRLGLRASGRNGR